MKIDPDLGDLTALLAAVVESSDDAIVSKTLDGRVTSWNAAAERIFGYSAEEMVGQNILTIIPVDRRDEEKVIIAQIKRGERVAHYDTIRRRKDGRLIDVSLTVSPVRNARGEVIGASKIARDIGDRRRLEQAQKVLSREVNHRSKNLLAIVEAIIRQTALQSEPEDFTRRISQRLHALSANQDLLIGGNWLGAEMAELARSQLEHIDPSLADRVSMSGPDLLLTPVATQALGLALHELAVNAARHGALARPDGRVALTWDRLLHNDVPCFVVRWAETGGPVVRRPARLGFGATILGRITAETLQGDITHEFLPTGLVWEVSAPAALGLVEEAGVTV